MADVTVVMWAVKPGGRRADRRVDGGFKVHVHSSLSRSKWPSSPYTRAIAKTAGVSQPVAGQGGIECGRSDDSSHHQHASWADAADAGACGGVPGELPEVFDREDGPC